MTTGSELTRSLDVGGGSRALGRVDWLVAVQFSPKTTQEHLGTAVLVPDVFGQFVVRELAWVFDGLAELGFKGVHLFVVFALREPLQ
jgi:hypothetical protein